jgi:hypothetical protein
MGPSSHTSRRAQSPGDSSRWRHICSPNLVQSWTYPGGGVPESTQVPMPLSKAALRQVRVSRGRQVPGPGQSVAGMAVSMRSSVSAYARGVFPLHGPVAGWIRSEQTAACAAEDWPFTPAPGRRCNVIGTGMTVHRPPACCARQLRQHRALPRNTFPGAWTMSWRFSASRPGGQEGADSCAATVPMPLIGRAATRSNLFCSFSAARPQRAGENTKELP